MLFVWFACHPEPAEETALDSGTPATTATCLAGGACDDGDPCTVDFCAEDGCDATAVTCDAPPDASCLDATTLRTYAAAGVCGADGCAYESTDTVCDLGCADAACVLPPVDQVAWVAPIDALDGVIQPSVAAAPDGDVVVTAAARTTTQVAGVPVSAVGSVIARFGPDGALRWARPLHALDPDAYYDEPWRVGVAGDGAIWVGASVYGTVRLAPGDPAELAVGGEVDLDRAHAVVARLDGDGLPLFALDLATTAVGGVTLSEVAGTGDGGVVVGGARAGDLDLGGTVLTGAATFVARYDASGALVWAWDGPPGAQAVVGTGAGQVVVFAMGVGGSAELVALSDADGSVVWSDTVAATVVAPTGVVGTPDGGAVGVALYDGALTVATGGALDLADPGMFGAAVIAWGADGVPTWSRGVVAAPGASLAAALPTGVAVAEDGAIEVVGTGFDDLLVDDGAAGVGVPGVSVADAWYARYAADGTLLHAAIAGSTGIDGGSGVAWPAGAGPVVVATIERRATFGAGEPGEVDVDATDAGVVLSLSP